MSQPKVSKKPKGPQAAETEETTKKDMRSRYLVSGALLVFFLALLLAGSFILRGSYGSYLGMYLVVAGIVGGVLSLCFAITILVDV